MRQRRLVFPLFYPGRNLHCSQTLAWRHGEQHGFTQVVIYIALKPGSSFIVRSASFTQVVIYIALKPKARCTGTAGSFTQVVIYIALKR